MNSHRLLKSLPLQKTLVLKVLTLAALIAAFATFDQTASAECQAPGWADGTQENASCDTDETGNGVCNDVAPSTGTSMNVCFWKDLTPEEIPEGSTRTRTCTGGTCPVESEDCWDAYSWRYVQCY